jgi:ribonuclease VapC
VFLDASAMVAMMTNEEDARRLAGALDRPGARLTSPIAVYETAAALSRLDGRGVARATGVVAEFLDRQRITVVPIPAEAAALALDAFARYGKGQDHPAQLNMGDCFAYACARHFGEPLLFEGDDFARTDVESALG